MTRKEKVILLSIRNYKRRKTRIVKNMALWSFKKEKLLCKKSEQVKRKNCNVISKSVSVLDKEIKRSHHGDVHHQTACNEKHVSSCFVLINPFVCSICQLKHSIPNTWNWHLWNEVPKHTSKHDGTVEKDDSQSGVKLTFRILSFI